MATAAASTAPASAVEPAYDAARELYERHERRVFRFCLSRLRCREEAEDARQTTFLQAFRALRAGVVPIAESSWLLKIAENVCTSRRNEALRRTAFEVAGPPEEIQSLPAPAGAAPEVLMPLEDALARLTERQRRALLLREWRGLSYREIAEQLEIGRGAAEVLTFRARRSLAAELEAPEARPRRRLRSLDVGWLASGAKSLVGGAPASVKATAAVFVAATTATTLTWALPRDASRPTDTARSAVALPARAAAARAETVEGTAGAGIRVAPPPVRVRQPSPHGRPAAKPADRDDPATAPPTPAARTPTTKPPTATDETAEESTATIVETATDSVEATLAPVTDVVASAPEAIVAAAEPVTEAVTGVTGELTAAASEASSVLPLEPLVPSG